MHHRWTVALISLCLLATATACGDDADAPGEAPDAAPDATAEATSDAPTVVPTVGMQPVGERMIDVGGYRMAIRCQGQGAPTVVFENGAFPVQDIFGDEMAAQVALEHRICTYDRAGTGKSEAGPSPRDAKQISDELHLLLTNAGETGPFVLAAWSAGAFYTPLYATAHPDNVAGYVFIDPRLAAYQLEVGTPPPVVAGAEAFAPVYGDEMRAWDASSAQVRDAGPLPERPLVVLTQGSPQGIADMDTQPGGYALWRSSHADLAASVAGGSHVVVEDAGHAIWEGNPQAVLDAISVAAGEAAP